jgi:cyclic dehypoxanthinyl futalosine synthase
MEENVVSAAGTSFRLTVADIRSAITELGYEARQRDNWYRLVG